MALDPTFGILIKDDTNEPVSVFPSDMSTIVAPGTAPDADPNAFPYGVAVLVRTSDTALRAKLGTTGTLPDFIKGVADQVGTFQGAADIFVIREEVGSTALETITNLIGSMEDLDGIYASLLCGPDHAKIPRVFAVPGFTHQEFQGVKAGAITAGSGGTDGTFALGFTGGTASIPASGTFTVVDGKLTSVSIENHGVYSVAPTALNFSASTGLTGASAVLSLDTFANPIIAALPPVLEQLNAVAFVEGPGTTESAIKAWREKFNHKRLIPMDMWVKVLENGSIVTKPGVSRVIGQQIAVDYENEGVPSHVAANRQIQGIVGLLRTPTFSLTSGTNEGQSLLEANIGIGTRGELGVETAIANSGFVCIVTDTSTDDPDWIFYNAVRLRDYTHLGLLKTIRFFLGRNNINAHTVQAILNTTTRWLGDLQANDHILGHRVGFDADQNSPENIRLGRFAYYFQSEEPPVLRRVDISSRKYRPALEDLVENLLATVQPTTLAA